METAVSLLLYLLLIQDRISQLEDELRRVSEENHLLRATPATAAANALRGKVLSTVDRELANLRTGSNGRSGNKDLPSLSVKNLINSIEKQVKSTPPQSPPTLDSRRSSVDSMGFVPDSPGPTSSPLSGSSSTPGSERRISMPNSILHSRTSPSSTAAGTDPATRRPHSVMYDSVSDDMKITTPRTTPMKDNDSPKHKPTTSILKTSTPKSSSRRTSVG